MFVSEAARKTNKLFAVHTDATSVKRKIVKNYKFSTLNFSSINDDNVACRFRHGRDQINYSSDIRVVDRKSVRIVVDLYVKSH